MTAPVIRRVMDADFETYQALMLEGVRTHPDRFRLTEADVMAELPPFGDDPDGFTLGAFVNGQLVGVISVAREKREKLRHKALLSRMYVAPDHSRQGLGRQLVNHAVREARELAGVRHITLTVLSDNQRAKRMYEEVGFAAFAHETGSVHAQGRDYDEDQMKLVLR